MAYSIKKQDIIDYPPEHLKMFKVDCYEWIDNLNFTLKPSECFSNHEAYIAVAKQLFLDAGWDGDGEVELMWIPPFAVKKETVTPNLGVTIWHVKQEEDGISWLLSPIDIYG